MYLYELYYRSTCLTRDAYVRSILLERESMERKCLGRETREQIHEDSRARDGWRASNSSLRELWSTFCLLGEVGQDHDGEHKENKPRWDAWEHVRQRCALRHQQHNGGQENTSKKSAKDQFVPAVDASSWPLHSFFLSLYEGLPWWGIR